MTDKPYKVIEDQRQIKVVNSHGETVWSWEDKRGLKQTDIMTASELKDELNGTGGETHGSI